LYNNDLANKLDLSAGVTVTLPYTPTKAGLLYATAIANTEGYSYIELDNALGFSVSTPIPHNTWSGFSTIFCPKGYAVSSSSSNVTGLTYKFFEFS
jgi:hypothetical protein